MGPRRRDPGASCSDGDRVSRRRLDDPEAGPNIEYAGWQPPPNRGAPNVVDRAPAATMSPKTFYDTYVAKRRPVVLTGGLQGTPWGLCCETWTDKFLVGHPEGDASVRVETRKDGFGSYGVGKYHPMRFTDFVKRFANGDDSVYLTASPSSVDAHGRPSVVSAPASFLVGTHRPAKAPFRPKIAGNLVPANVNLWMGAAGTEKVSKSGLHHDHHDNLYVLLRGVKKIELFPPSAVLSMYTTGTPCKVHKNGVINYKETGETAEDGDDGALRRRVLSANVRDAETEVEACEVLVANGEPEAEARLRRAEEALDQAMDGTIGDVGGDDDDDDDDENGAFAGRDDFDDVCDSDLECVTGTDGEDDGEDEDNLVTNGTDGTEMEGDVVVSGVREDETREEKETETENPEPDPPSFSKTSRGGDVSKSFPLFRHARETSMMETTVRAGEIIFLPAGWFHEVSSSGSGAVKKKEKQNGDDNDADAKKKNQEGDQRNTQHAALNYWFHPPVFGADFATPYGEKQEMWEQDWSSWETLFDTEAGREKP